MSPLPPSCPLNPPFVPKPEKQEKKTNYDFYETSAREMFLVINPRFEVLTYCESIHNLAWC